MAKAKKPAKPKQKPPTKQKYIKTPAMLAEYFKQYKTETKANPFLIKDWVGGFATQVHREKEKPLTLEGFNVWLFSKGIITDAKDYFDNRDGRYGAYVVICRAIREEIRADQIAGGMAGIYNPSITQRLNGLTEKQEVTTRTIKVTTSEDE